MLLSHGSYYLSMEDQENFYGNDAQFVAPEVLQHGSIDDRCDVYSIGKFMQALGNVSDMPIEFRRAMKKATSESPEDRYNSPEELLDAVRSQHHIIRSAVVVGISCVIALVCVGLYFDMFPETNPVEFVKPVPRQPTDDLLDDGFDPSELGVTNSGDSLIYDEASERDYLAKAEEIFRKKYTEEAERILSKIYNKEYMSNAEKKFTSESQSTIDELMKKQAELGSNAGLTPERSQLIATEIIDRITEQKKKEMGGTNSRAIQK
jgi:serine/threonine protein kinase